MKPHVAIRHILEKIRLLHSKTRMNNITHWRKDKHFDYNTFRNFMNELAKQAKRVGEEIFFAHVMEWCAVDSKNDEEVAHRHLHLRNRGKMSHSEVHLIKEASNLPGGNKWKRNKWELAPCLYSDPCTSVEYIFFKSVPCLMNKQRSGLGTKTELTRRWGRIYPSRSTHLSSCLPAKKHQDENWKSQGYGLASLSRIVPRIFPRG